MSTLHKQLSDERWHAFSVLEQMANIGSEVERALNWQAKNDRDASEAAFYRALDLIDLSLKDKKYKNYKELARMREVLCDYFTDQNDYNSTPQSIQSYFQPFFLAVAKDR